MCLFYVIEETSGLLLSHLMLHYRLYFPNMRTKTMVCMAITCLYLVLDFSTRLCHCFKKIWECLHLWTRRINGMMNHDEQRNNLRDGNHASNILISLLFNNLLWFSAWRYVLVHQLRKIALVDSFCIFFHLSSQILGFDQTIVGLRIIHVAGTKGKVLSNLYFLLNFS